MTEPKPFSFEDQPREFSAFKNMAEQIKKDVLSLWHELEKIQKHIDEYSDLLKIFEERLKRDLTREQKEIWEKHRQKVLQILEGLVKKRLELEKIINAMLDAVESLTTTDEFYEEVLRNLEQPYQV
jgi:predicted  nucleic acid-binding Zn-ribbon protein